jgi:dolichol-phosphate mannosyltransferase
LNPKRRALLAQLGKFLLVGGSGVLVNSLALSFLFQLAHLPLVAASLVSTELAIASNFLGNDLWTFGRRGLEFGRFARFNLVSLGGLGITSATLWLLATQLGLYYLVANLLGIALATAWNFAANVAWTWRQAP